MTDSGVASPTVTLELIRGELPAAIEQAAIVVADGPYTSLLQTRAFEPEIVPALHHLVIRQDDRVLSVLSFTPAPRALTVVNEAVMLDDGVLGPAVNRLFDEYPAVSRIEFRRLHDVDCRSLGGRPVRRTGMASENFVIDLPLTVEEYHSRFVPRTIKKMRNYDRRIRDEFSGVSLDIIEGPAIGLALITEMARLNDLRMHVKGGYSLIDAEYAERLLTLSQRCGVAVVYRTSDRVLGGTVNTRIGRHWSLQLIAHDPECDHLSLGSLALMRTIEFAIGSGATSFHLLWGRNAYKDRFGGRLVPLTDLHVYRSRAAALLAWNANVQRSRARVTRLWRSFRRHVNKTTILRALGTGPPPPS
jgi:CelD/BcsL family acetyltransferase involved in cellulose biosynthesis